MKPRNLVEIVDGRRYKTETAVLLAHDVYWDGRNMERNGRNTFLFKTAKGNFFVQRQSLWAGERDYIEPLVPEEAMALYAELSVKEVDFEEAFGFSPEEA